MRTFPLLLCLLLLVPACGGEDEEVSTTPPATPPGPTADEPDRVAVDHILIGVKGPRIPQGKTPEEARTLAYDLLEQLRGGADWAALKQEHSDDPPPGGPYEMANHGVTPAHGREYAREGMAPAFGDVGFSLEMGEIGIADYDEETSPFGFHIIKRVDPPAPQPDRVTVDHILIGVKGARMPDGQTPEEARALAYDLLEQLRGGADWAALKQEHSDDPPPGGPYTMVNHRVRPSNPDEFPRAGMAPAFGNVGFALDVGEIRIADYDSATSPFGFHIIKRIR
ncbi:MAG: peptidylprolyl isomerase [Planctomycetota bacterium]